jgi:hypothetical protein
MLSKHNDQETYFTKTEWHIQMETTALEELHEVFWYNKGVQCSLYSSALQSNTQVSCQTFSGNSQ